MGGGPPLFRVSVAALRYLGRSWGPLSIRVRVMTKIFWFGNEAKKRKTNHLVPGEPSAKEASIEEEFAMPQSINILKILKT